MSRLLPHRLSRGKGDTDDLAAQLAPLEEQERQHAKAPDESCPPNTPELVTQEFGAIVVGDHKARLAEDTLEDSKRKEILGFDPVVLVIAGLMLLFILFIAWQVSRMPGPVN